MSRSIRNIPLLLQLLFWYAITAGAAAAARRRCNPVPACSCQQPRPAAARGWSGRPAHLCRAGAFAGRRSSAPGSGALGDAHAQCSDRPAVARSGRSALGLIVGLPLLVWLALGAPLDARLCRSCAASTSAAASADQPGVRRAAARASSIYTAAFIAEIVRAGILAVQPRARWEAAQRARPARAAQALRLDRAAAGAARDHPADDQPVPQPDQEQLARGGDRLSRPRRRSPTPR